ncbi:hypothetical protein KRX19_06830 [Cardiobacteriaceae bacterium TAE3-ERU3]|nr:hypothetical protein [Cardiobacteriaceae bacterium TAE3-ERU3]
MPLSIKWIILWGVLLSSMVIYLSFPSASQPNPIPASITQISTTTTKLNLILNSANQWQSPNGEISAEQQKLIHRWVNDLQTGCSKNAYPEQSIKPHHQQDDFSFHINGKAYRFGTFNTYAEQHYLYHNGQAYLCQPTLRPRLENAHQLWITTNA